MANEAAAKTGQSKISAQPKILFIYVEAFISNFRSKNQFRSLERKPTELVDSIEKRWSSIIFSVGGIRDLQCFFLRHETVGVFFGTGFRMELMVFLRERDLFP